MTHKMRSLVVMTLICLVGLTSGYMIIFGNQNQVPTIISTSPASSAIPAVVDNHGFTWDYDIIDVPKLEVGETLHLYVQWALPMTNSKLYYEGGIGASSPNSTIDYPAIDPDLGCDGTVWTNFSIPITAVEATTAFRQFQIQSYTVSGSNKQTSGYQVYNVLAGENPTPFSAASISWETVTVDQNLAIQLDWPAVVDNVGIARYDIYRKAVSGITVITTSNYDDLLTSKTDSYTDVDLPDVHGLYAYAVQAVDYAGRKGTLQQMLSNATIDSTAPVIANGYPLYFLNDQSYTIGGEQEPEGSFKIDLVSDSDCSSVVGYLILTEGGVPPYKIEFTKISNVWHGTINLAQPRATLSNSMVGGTYNLSLTITDKAGNSNTVVVGDIFIILESDSSIQPGDTNFTIYAIIGGVGIAAIVAVILLVRKKKLAAAIAASTSDVEMSTGPAKKKRGKIYSGASSIGKASGQDADALQERRGIKGKPGIPEKPSSTKASIPTAKTGATAPTSVKKTTPSKPVDDDLDSLLGDVSTGDGTKSKPINEAMAMKQAESSVDTTRRLDFTVAKAQSLEQNLMLMNLLLNQTAESESVPKVPCPKCGRLMAQSWPKCPYCLVDDRKAEVSQKMAQVTAFGSERICPLCRKVMHPSWSKCPYCFVRQAH